MSSLSASSSFRTSSSHPGGAGEGAIASASTVGDSNIDARRNLDSPQAGQFGSSSVADREIEYPHPTQTNDPTAASSPVCPASVTPSTNKPITIPSSWQC